MVLVSANGAYQDPIIPASASQFEPAVGQLSIKEYKHPAEIPPRTTLVVGDGATGRQTARELAASHRVLLAIGKPRWVTTDRFLGKSFFW